MFDDKGDGGEQTSSYELPNLHETVMETEEIADIRGGI